MSTQMARTVPRIATLVEQHADFVWRSLHRLGVPESTTDDAVQQVFLTLQSKLDQIVSGKERAFLFAISMNVAAHARRSLTRRREVDEALADEVADERPLPDEAMDQKRARMLLDEVLETMDMDLRTVFVMHELEEMTMAEIAEVLVIPPGTVASRLRRSRETFHDQAQRIRARIERRRTFPDATGATTPTRLAVAGGGIER